MSRTQNILLAVHIPKTGGMTFKDMLADIFQERFVWVKGNKVEDHVPDETRTLVSAQNKKGDGLTVVYGHYFLDPFVDSYPDAKLACWIRDPVQRLLSDYYYRERSGAGMNYGSDEIDNEENIYSFVSQPHHHNTLSRMIGRSDISKFDFVGSTEEFEKSLALFSAIFSTKKAYSHKNKILRRILKLFKTNEVHVKHRNRNPDRKSALYPVSEELKQRILALNRDDEILYQAGLARFEELVKRWLDQDTPGRV